MLSFVLHVAAFVGATVLVEYVTRIRLLNYVDDEIRALEARNRAYMAGVVNRIKITLS